MIINHQRRTSSLSLLTIGCLLAFSFIGSENLYSNTQLISQHWKPSLNLELTGQNWQLNEYPENVCSQFISEESCTAQLSGVLQSYHEKIPHLVNHYSQLEFYNKQKSLEPGNGGGFKIKNYGRSSSAFSAKMSADGTYTQKRVLREQQGSSIEPITKNQSFTIPPELKRSGFVVVSTDSRFNYGSENEDFKININSAGKTLTFSFYAKKNYIQLKEVNLLTQGDSSGSEITKYIIDDQDTVERCVCDVGFIRYEWSKEGNATWYNLYLNNQSVFFGLITDFQAKIVFIETDKPKLITFSAS
ncbi:hypothetical protein NX722_00075 [Endozoicomonas gorgoniicola]|uniref:Uncharacterized protein n=1 Tax=Endozoicomonas gorgoniicola TaxID=1234144 RepID=A0ABT3MNX8_9GAMM|nr:hypothetical protein [Endozoicomonas gorgoniicola]MCW7551082.1 hypothetical protein [Endozoicomonas gorgoniicola]